MISILTIQRKNVLDLNLFQMAQQLGCSESHLSNIENGKVKIDDTAMLRKIAKLYKLDFSAVVAELSPGGAKDDESNKSGVRKLPRVSPGSAAQEPKKVRSDLRQVSG